jgi:hypothetical protein
MVMQPQLFKTEGRSAVFSAGRIHRYTLWRRWSDGDKFVQFIGLNPSTADETNDDNTIRKCIKLANRWGFDALCMTNLFSYCATSPAVMKKYWCPNGWDNDTWLVRIALDASMIVAAWSQDGNYKNRSEIVQGLLSNFDLYCLRFTGSEPWHPLYLPDDTKPFLWRQRGR